MMRRKGNGQSIRPDIDDEGPLTFLADVANGDASKCAECHRTWDTYN